MKVQIDGDLITYPVAAVCDGKQYEASDGHRERYKKDILKYLKGKDLDVSIIYEPEPIENCLHSVKLVLQDILKACDGAGNFQIYLTGSNNFRYEYGTILPYKGNRASYRPTHLQACRDYLVEHWDAIVTEDQEADDACGIAQMEAGLDNSLLASNDKDLDMIPGWHYNWNKDLRYYVTEVEGLRNFYSQLLTGDSTDNILGLFGVGKKSTLVSKLEIMGTEAEMFGHVFSCYSDRFGSYAEKFLIENARLLWIRREPNQIWEMPDGKETT